MSKRVTIDIYYVQRNWKEHKIFHRIDKAIEWGLGGMDKGFRAVVRPDVLEKVLKNSAYDTTHRFDKIEFTKRRAY